MQQTIRIISTKKLLTNQKFTLEMENQIMGNILDDNEEPDAAVAQEARVAVFVVGDARPIGRWPCGIELPE